jgi:transcriptional regulator with XRE-family HTH domain
MADPAVEQLAAYVHQAALAAGYDLDAPRSGDKTRLAKDAGISLTSLSRLLSRDRMPDTRALPGLAMALRVPIADLLVKGGIMPEDALTTPPPERPLTPDEVAKRWGVQDEAGKALITAMYERLAAHRGE